jgi:hypothetical protein
MASAFQQQAGRGDAAEGAEGLQDGVGFGLIFAVGAQALPHEGDGVQAQDFHALIRQEEHDVQQFAKDGRVGVIQVPLEFVEGGPDPFVERFVVGEAAGLKFGEDFAHGHFVLVGQRAVGKHEVVILVSWVAGGRFLRPVMFFGGVVADQVYAQADFFLAQLGGKMGQIGHCAQVVAHGAVVHHGVAAIAGAGARLEQGHEVQVGDAQFFEIGDFVGDAAQGSGEAVGVGDVAHHVGLLEPVGLVDAAQV